MHPQKYKIIVVGAGKVATHLTKRFRKRGIAIAQIVNRSIGKAKALGTATKPPIAYATLDAIDTDGDWYILAVSDNALAEVADFLRKKIKGKPLITHVSGATPSTVFEGKFERYGVFYPLQSFSESTKPAWTKIPICIYASTTEDTVFLKKTARILSKNVHHINDEQRAALHLSAVYVNNFVNHLYTIAEALLEEHNAPMELLHPLMEETVRKAVHFPPKSVQTGPALRDDKNTMERHLTALNKHPNWKALYALLSEDIQKHKA